MFIVDLKNFIVFISISSNLWHMQSKNGGLAAWEPAGAADWLEVSTITY
jgi:hypothetical protein